MNKIIVKNLIEGAASIGFMHDDFKQSVKRFELRAKEYAQEFSIDEVAAINKVSKIRLYGQLACMIFSIISMTLALYFAFNKNLHPVLIVLIFFSGFIPLIAAKIIQKKS